MRAATAIGSTPRHGADGVRAAALHRRCAGGRSSPSPAPGHHGRPRRPRARCRCASPKIASGFGSSNAPSSSIRRAPPRSPGGGPSSAGWNTNSTVPGSCSRTPASSLGDTEQDRGVRVVTAGVHHADLLARVVVPRARRERQAGLLGHRQRVHVGAQRDHRAAAGRRAAPPPRRSARRRCRTSRPSAREPLRDHARPCAARGSTSSGCCVQVAAPLDHARLERRVPRSISRAEVGREARRAATSRRTSDPQDRSAKAHPPRRRAGARVPSARDSCRREVPPHGRDASTDDRAPPARGLGPGRRRDRVARGRERGRRARLRARRALPGTLLLASGVASLLLWSDPRAAAHRRARRRARRAALAADDVRGAAAPLALLLLARRRPRSPPPAPCRCARRPSAGRRRSRSVAAALGRDRGETMPCSRCSTSRCPSPSDDGGAAASCASSPPRTSCSRRRAGSRSRRATTPRRRPFAGVASAKRRAARRRLRAPARPSELRPAPRRARPRALARLRGQPRRARLAAAPRTPARPWLVCIHGYRMGHAPIDLTAFRAARAARPARPERAAAGAAAARPAPHRARIGDGFLGGDLLDTVHAEAQAMWDLRRCSAGSARESGAPIGAYGLSLGGYNAALLASLDADLACVIAGIPATDLARAGLAARRPCTCCARAESRGLERERAERVLRVVSPLALAPLVPRERRCDLRGQRRPARAGRARAAPRPALGRAAHALVRGRAPHLRRARRKSGSIWRKRCREGLA